jgi:hypothetical protein
MSTGYHAKYFAHELTKRCPSDSVGKLAASLADAQVDLNPHQIDAALFAFRSPLSKEAEAVNEPLGDLGDNFETLDELEDEWETDEEGADIEESKPERVYTPEQIAEMKHEVRTLREFGDLAKSIIKNSKGEALMTALKRGFDEARARGSNGKAIIFTESRRTQEYLRNILQGTEFVGKVVLFNGTNDDPESKEIYRGWLAKHQGTDRVSGSPTADKRAALVDYFREEATIMIATEAAAEGINLQFCSLVVNYDLPWNPQRIEQRIGRCHRYGQKYDVVVVNFLNKKNAADQRVYQLLDEKFKLFSGVFGASDEVLGAIESGVDFEKRIVDICQRCRTEEQIEFEFDSLQHVMEEKIQDRMRQTRQKLLDNFDEEVHEKLRLKLKESSEYLDKYETWLWSLTCYYLAPCAQFKEGEYSFTLLKNPFPDETIHSGPYRVGKNVEDANIYRVGHPLAQHIIEECKNLQLTPKMVNFTYTGRRSQISVLEPLVGKEGWLRCTLLKITAFEEEEHVLLAGIADDGTMLDVDLCRRLFSLAGEEDLVPANLPANVARRLDEAVAYQRNQVAEQLTAKNATYFEAELDKLDRWGEDQRNSLKDALKELEERIREEKKQARLAPNLPQKLKFERQRRSLEAKRDAAWKAYEEEARRIEKDKDQLIDDVEARLKQSEHAVDLFTLRWRVI